MPYSVQLIRQLENVDPEMREILLGILEEIERQREESVTKNEFNELKDVVKELAEAQKRTEERIGRVEKAIEELAEAQKRTEKRVEELAEAQKKTERAIQKLTHDLGETREHLGGLSDTVGYILEDEAIGKLPVLLKKRYGIEIEEKLIRDYIDLGGREKQEVNIFGKGKQSGNEIIIFGEAESKLGKKKIDKIIKMSEQIKNKYGKEVFTIAITYHLRPEVKMYAKEKDINVIVSYELKQI